MRALVALLAACAPIRDPSPCPLPCPASCSTSCLPGGYCRSAQWQPDPAPVVRSEVSLLQVSLGDLPPDAGVAVHAHWLIDFPTRAPHASWDYSFEVRLGVGGPLVANASAFNAVDFPLTFDWTGIARTNGDGAANLDFEVYQCRNRDGTDGCAWLQGSFVTVELVDAAPWETAPRCR